MNVVYTMTYCQRVHLALLWLCLLLFCRGRSLDAGTSVRYCKNRLGNDPQKCFELRLKIALPVGGLFNQHLSLLSFLTLGISSGCTELLIEYSPRRKHSVALSLWDAEPFDSLWDVMLLSNFLQGHGIRLMMGSEIDPSVLHLENFQSLQEHFEDIGDAVDALKAHVLHEISHLPDSVEVSDHGFPTTVEVPAGSMFRSLQTGSSHLYKEIARHTQMAPHLQSLAQACIDRMEAGGADKFYIGIHLRIEDDFERSGRTGGRSSMLALYSEALKQLQIAPDEHLYIASGIFGPEPDFAGKHLQGWSERITHRKMLLLREEMSSLDVEQRAAIDFLIVSKASKFIGWQGSSFSFWVVEERLLNGLDASTSHLISGAEGMASEQEAFVRSNGIARP